MGALLGLNDVAQQALATGEEKQKQKKSLERATCWFGSMAYALLLLHQGLRSETNHGTRNTQMFGKLKTLAIALHKDERGDMAQIVLAVALIVIPLMLLLLAFGKQIGEWFNEKNTALSDAERIPEPGQ
ncbi:hypothetical protein [Rhizobium lentis]|nr:hypothetical protein [Rhizobium lentis]